MAEEVAKDVHEDDVEGQISRNAPGKIHANESTPGSDAEPKMTDSDDDVEGQVYRNKLHRIS